MRISFREGFYGGLAAALLLGLYLIWLWRPEHQLRLHSANLIATIEKKDWIRFAAFVGSDYQDQWGNDHAFVLERTREVFRYLRNVRVTAVNPNVWTADNTGYWKAKIMIDGETSEVMALVKERVNSIPSPFQLEWHRMSAKPWDWKLVRVSNDELVIPSEFQ